MDNIAEIVEPLLSEDDVYRIAKENHCHVERRARHMVKGKPFVRVEFVLARNEATGFNAGLRRASLFATKLKGSAPRTRNKTLPYIPESNLRTTLGQLGVTFG